MQENNGQENIFFVSSTDDLIDIEELVKIVLQNKVKLLAIMALCLGIAGGVSFTMPKMFNASATLIVSDHYVATAQTDGLSAISQLAGIGVGSSSHKVTYAIEVLKSKEFLLGFIDQNNLAPMLLAGQNWDSEHNEWEFNDDVYDVAAESWLIDRVPKMDLYNKFRDNLSIEFSSDTGVLILSYKSMSPFDSSDLVNKMISGLNDRLRSLDIADSEKNISYLVRQLETVSNTDMQVLLYGLIETETQRKMLANTREDFAFKVIDKAMLPEQKYSPNRSVICLLGLGVGVVLCGAYLFFVLVFSSKVQDA